MLVSLHDTTNKVFGNYLGTRARKERISHANLLSFTDFPAFQKWTRSRAPRNMKVPYEFLTCVNKAFAERKRVYRILLESKEKTSGTRKFVCEQGISNFLQIREIPSLYDKMLMIIR